MTDKQTKPFKKKQNLLESNGWTFSHPHNYLASN